MGAPQRAVRGFRLLVEPDQRDTFGVRLEETNGSSERAPRLIARATAPRVRRVQASLIEVLRASHVQRTAVHARRVKPVDLDEAAGVRFALVLLATAPLRKGRRVDAIERAVATMSAEEAYYWYAKCTGDQSSRARRALRLLLAPE